MQNRKRRNPLKAAAIYAAVSAFCVAFGAVYTHFAYGNSSPFLTWMFMLPMLLGAIPCALMYVRGVRLPVRAVRNFWNSGVALLTVGCLVRGVINISGRYTEYDTIYWALGAAFLLAAAVCLLVRKARGASGRGGDPIRPARRARTSDPPRI